MQVIFTFCVISCLVQVISPQDYLRAKRQGFTWPLSEKENDTHSQFSQSTTVSTQTPTYTTQPSAINPSTGRSPLRPVFPSLRPTFNPSKPSSTQRPILTSRRPVLAQRPTTNRTQISTNFPVGSTSSPNSSVFLKCVRGCPATTQYNPVCASNMVTYQNVARLNCAIRCGLDIQKVFNGSCKNRALFGARRNTTQIPQNG